MKQEIDLLKVIRIVRDFSRNEAQTIEISKGKMLNDQDAELGGERALRTG
jgi:hypothetical protein